MEKTVQFGSIARHRREEVGNVDGSLEADIDLSGEDHLGEFAALDGGDGLRDDADEVVVGGQRLDDRLGGRLAGLRVPISHRTRTVMPDRGQLVPGVTGKGPADDGHPLLPVRASVVEDLGDDHGRRFRPVEGERPEGDHRGSASLGLIVTGDGGQDPSDRDEIGWRVEPGLEPEGACRTDPDQQAVAGVVDDPGVPGQGVGIDRRARGDPSASGGQGPRRRGGHGRPCRVAVNSWLSPPERARRLTEEKPASLSIERSWPVGGR